MPDEQKYFAYQISFNTVYWVAQPHSMPMFINSLIAILHIFDISCAIVH